jgi:hypothetical protein
MSKAAIAASLLLMLMLMLLASDDDGHRQHLASAANCSGNELSSVIGGCAGTVVSGATPALGSPCCNAIRAVNFPCLCSQLAASPYAGSINPSTASAIKSSCRVQTPKGLRCAGFSRDFCSFCFSRFRFCRFGCFCFCFCRFC